MLNAFRKLWNDDRGNVLILAGACLPLLVGSAGIATDTIQWTLWKRQLQRAADSAALAGVYTRLNTDTQAAVDSAVATDLALNNHTGIALSSGYPQTALLADDGVKENPVRVTLRLSKSLPFSSMFMDAAPNIQASATAASVPGADEFCVFATDPSVSSTGIEITGSTKLDLGTCSLMANSKHPSQAASNGNSGDANNGLNSTVIAKSLAASGGVKYSNNWSVTDYDPNSPQIADPFANLPVPDKTLCNKTIQNMDKNQSYPMDRTTGPQADVAGEIVCFNGGVKVQGALQLQSNVTYVVDGGDLEMSSTGSSLRCTNCTIILTNYTNPANTGYIKLTGGTLDITAPTTGTYKGIALYQDRNATDDKTKTNQVNGNNGTSVTGAIYAGNRALLYNGGSETNAACLQIVTKRVAFSGNSKLKLTSECPLAGISPIGGGRRVRLVA